MKRAQVSKYQRCSICNFGALSPSQYISDKSSRSNKVVYNQTLNEHICLDCEQGMGLEKKKKLPRFSDYGQPGFSEWGPVPLIDEDFDSVEPDEIKLESN